MNHATRLGIFGSLLRILLSRATKARRCNWACQCLLIADK